MLNGIIYFDVSRLENGAITLQDQVTEPTTVELITTDSYSLSPLLELSGGLFAFTEYWPGSGTGNRAAAGDRAGRVDSLS